MFLALVPFAWFIGFRCMVFVYVARNYFLTYQVNLASQGGRSSGVSVEKDRVPILRPRYGYLWYLLGSRIYPE
ncbi:hypothetical protein F5X99DRAFT_179058 [Biscogniauxia marginata]|nr:hypothetical protein F5X99DRAFT_179058 [Biscogniauxia marginata]